MVQRPMNHFRIEVQGVGKDYERNVRRSDFFFQELFRSKGRSESFPALQDVSFQVEEGKTLGIVGSNGAGKSTLLKILSRVTRPDRGKVILRGRVAPLLEVGTGFHPDLSGRENVFLNGSLLGMQRREVAAIFEQIVDFSGVEEFIDSPVRNYSSGMYVRLAFAVAAHLRAEIMLVDEVLAVGDLAFQQKCLQKMEELSTGGRTVLLVTHQVENMLRLCDTALWLDQGRMMRWGDAHEVAEAYREVMIDKSMSSRPGERKDRRGSGEVRLEDLQLVDKAGEHTREVYTHQELRMRLRLSGSLASDEWPSVRVQLNFYNQNEQFIGSIDSGTCSMKQDVPLEAHVPVCPFYAGHYWVIARILVNGHLTDRLESALSFEVKTGKDIWTHRKSGMRYSIDWKVPGSE